MSNRSDKYKLIFLFLIALGIRVYKLNVFPIGITHDELNYIMSAKSLFLTGGFIPQTAPAIFPTDMTTFNVVIAEIPAILIAPFIGILEFSLFSSRFIGAVFSSLTVVVLYFLVREITKNRIMALFSALVLTINPWGILMGRTIFEANFYILFFLLGLLVLLRSSGWKIFYSFPLYLLGFLSYTGGQVVFYLFIVITLIYKHFYNKGKIITPLVIYAIIISLVFGGYLYLSLRNQSMLSRGSELFLPSSDTISQKVNEERTISVPSEYNHLFINKATVYLRGFIEKYIDAFSPTTLFLNGEYRAAFSYQKHGTFYLTDFIFIIIGICFLFQRYRKAWIFFIAIVAIAPLTAGFSIVEHSYSQRAGLIYPVFVIFTAAGISFIYSGIVNIRLQKIFISIIAVIYVAFLINLFHLYLFRFPVYASDGWFYHDRLLSRYVQLTLEKHPEIEIAVYSSEPKITFEEYLYFTNGYRRETAKLINGNLENGLYAYGKVSFSSICPDGNEDKEGVVEIYDPLLGCDINKNEMLRITRYYDVLEMYLIKNDLICEKVKLNNYVYPEAYRDFDVNHQFDDVFCRNWITKLNN